MHNGRVKGSYDKLWLGLNLKEKFWGNFDIHTVNIEIYAWSFTGPYQSSLWMNNYLPFPVKFDHCAPVHPGWYTMIWIQMDK